MIKQQEAFIKEKEEVTRATEDRANNQKYTTDQETKGLQKKEKVASITGIENSLKDNRIEQVINVECNGDEGE